MSDMNPPPADVSRSTPEHPVPEDGPSVLPPSWAGGGLPSAELPRDLPWWKQQAGREEGTPLPGLGPSIARQLADDQAKAQ